MPVFDRRETHQQQRASLEQRETHANFTHHIERTRPKDSIEWLTVHRHLDKTAHVVVERLDVEILIHLIDDGLDAPFHLAFAVDNSTSPVPGLENSKDVLDRVQFGGVRREEDVVDVVFVEESCC